MIFYLTFSLNFYLTLSFIISSNSDVQNNNNNLLLRESALHTNAYINSPFLSNQRSLTAVKVDPKGTVYTTQILKQQLANELKLPLRDLRVVDPSYPSQIQATFTARPNTILFCIENIKVVLKYDEALIFSPSQPEVQEFVPALQQQISQSIANDALMTVNPSTNRFEHIVIEAALNVVCNNLFKRVRALSPAVSSALNGLRAESRGLDVIQTQVDELLPLKNKLDLLKKKVMVIKKAITDILNSDQDMAMMYLAPIDKQNIISNKLSSDSKEIANTNDINIELDNNNNTISSVNSLISDNMDLEMLFENYLNEFEWILSEIEGLLDNITNTEENVVLQLDLLRNRILKFELFLSISSFVVTCGALVTGLFGMNLLSHFENNTSMFYIVTTLMISSMFWTFISFRRYGKREKLF